MVVRAGTAPSPWSVYEALMTPNTLPPCDTSSTEVSSTPVHPLASSSAWPCVSCPRTKVTSTSAAVDRPVLRVAHGHRERDGVAEGEECRPRPGSVTVTDGAVLPTVMIVLANAVLPLESVTVSRAVYWPLVV